MPTINLVLPKLTPKQRKIEASPAKRKILVAGRRFGKTTLFAKLAAEDLLQGRKTIEAAPTTKQTGAFWRRLKTYMRPLIESGVVKKWENERILEMASTGGFVQTQTAWDADTLRGDWADRLMLDEYSYMHASAWTVVGAPMLLDTNGSAIFAFTPNLKNHAYALYTKAKADKSGFNAVFHGTSFDNPHLSRRALEKIMFDMTDRMIRQEIYAEFLDSEGQVFRNIAACLLAPLVVKPSSHKGHRLVGGVDWGKEQDFTSVSIGCADCKAEVARDRFNQLDYIFQRGRIANLYKRWGLAGLLPERNAMGEPIIEQLQQDGISVILGQDGKPGFQATASTKPPLIENLALCLERTEWQFQNDDVWTAELEMFERKVSGNTGRSSYGAPEGSHDDTVIARALMLWASQRTASQIWV